MLYAVILAGGKGERFWPLSTPEHPKPFLKLFSERSLLQQTFDRLCKFVPAAQVLLVVGEQHLQISREQIPELSEAQLLAEPQGRDTAAAIGFASLHLPSDALMLVLPADHLIPDQAKFMETVLGAVNYVRDHGGPCTFGIIPSRPETNYGYVKAKGESVGPSGFPVYQVERFVEKPDLTTAGSFLREGSYYWNSGIFLWKVSVIQELIARLLPDLWKGLLEVRAETNAERRRSLYGALQRISIDFGVMQKADKVVVVPAGFPWDDIGTWTSLLRVLPVDGEANLTWGSHIGIDTSNCILYAENHTMVTAGIRDLVIVQRGRNTLICHKDYADRLKELLAKLPT